MRTTPRSRRLHPFLLLLAVVSGTASASIASSPSATTASSMSSSSARSTTSSLSTAPTSIVRKRKKRRRRDDITSSSASRVDDISEVDDLDATTEDNMPGRGHHHLPSDVSSITCDGLESTVNEGYQSKTKRKRRRKTKGSLSGEGGGSIDGGFLLPVSDEFAHADHVDAETRDVQSDGSSRDDSISSVSSDGEGSRPKTKRRRKRKRRSSSADTSIYGDQITDGGALLPIDDDFVDATADTSLQEEESVLGSECPQSSSLHKEDALFDDIPSTRAETLLDELDAENVFGNDDGSNPSSNMSASRNETTETITFQDDADADAPTTYEYTKHREEETIEERVPAVDSDDEAASQPAIIASTRSTQQLENMHISGGSTGQTVTIKVSRKRKEHSVHIITNKGTRQKSTTKKSSLAKPKRATSTAVTARGSGKGGECLRRIKREWKDAVKMGIAYDWTNMRTINRPDGGNDYVRIGPFGKNMLRWHFSVAGPANSPYEEGVYHGRVLLPRDYPGSPPRVQVLTPSGRFACGADICLSASSYHPETWSPRWTVLSLVDALRLHMLTTANEIGGVMAPDENRRQYARESRTWRSPGVVDHGRMVSAGIFPLRSSEGESEDEPIGEADETEKAQASQNGTLQHPLPSEPESGLLDTTTESILSPKKKASKASKQKKDRPQPTPNKRGSKLGKGSEANNRRTRVADKAKDVESLNANDQRGVLLILLKKMVIEMLKLPLRMLYILLRILSGLESRLRSILDSL